MNAEYSPELRDLEDRLDDLFDEISSKLRNGERVDLDDYERRYPELSDRIRNAFPGIRALIDLGHIAPESSTNINSTNSIQNGVLGDYRIIGEIGRGGMGVVYEAEEISLDRRVALKILPFAAMLDEKQLRRFKNEARAAAILEHPNIVSVYSVGAERGVHYYAMRLVQGHSLAEVLSELTKTNERQDVSDTSRDEVDSLATSQTDTTPIAAITTEYTANRSHFFNRIAKLGEQAALGLEHAHQQGVIHRDVKPANLLIDRDGKLSITDFGLARITTDPGVTMTGDLVGTMRYMSPEQAMAKRIIVDPRTDIYSLGITLYELVTLRPAFEADDRQALLTKIMFANPLSPQQLDSRIPSDLETIIQKAIEKDPQHRYATMADFADDLHRFQNGLTIMARPPSLLDRFWKWGQRRKKTVVAFSVSCFVVALISTVAAILVFRANYHANAALQTSEELRKELRENLELEARRSQLFKKVCSAVAQLAELASPEDSPKEATMFFRNLVTLLQQPTEEGNVELANEQLLEDIIDFVGLLVEGDSYQDVTSWKLSLSGPKREDFTDVVFDQQGNAIVVGEYSNDAIIGNGAKMKTVGPVLTDAIVAKVSSDGNEVLWHRTIGSEHDDDVTSVAVGTDGIYLVGTFRQQILIDDVILQANGGRDGFLAKLDFDGRFLWGETIGTERRDICEKVALSSDGHAYVTAYLGRMALTDEGRSVCIDKFSTDGKRIRRIATKGPHLASIRGLDVDSRGNVYVAGGFSGTMQWRNKSVQSVKGTDGYIVKVDERGTIKWVRTLSGVGDCVVRAVCVSDDGDIYLTGWFTDELKLEGPKREVLRSTGDKDIFLCKFGSDGSMQWSRHIGNALADYGEDIDIALDGSIVLLGRIQEPGVFEIPYTVSFLSEYDSDGTKSRGPRNLLSGDSHSDHMKSLTIGKGGTYTLAGATYDNWDSGQGNERKSTDGLILQLFGDW